MMRNIICFLSLLIFPAISQSQDVSGFWQGVLYQQNGVPVTYFPFSMILEQNGNNISGTSEIRSSNNSIFFGIMSLTGSFDGVEFEFQETGILDQLTGSTWYWCIKNGDLVYDENTQTLQGPWQSPGCNPGTIELYRLGVLSDTVFCLGESVDLEVSGQDVRWYSDEGLTNLVATGNSFTPTISSTTTYYVTQTHYGTESPFIPIHVVISNPIIETLEVTQVDCQNSTGSILVQTNGGIAPISYSIDGSNFQFNNLFEGLPPEVTL